MTLQPSRVLDLDSFHRFSVWMLDDREEAHARALAIVRAAPDADFIAWVASLIRALAVVEPRGRVHRDGFVALDALLRLDPDHPVEPAREHDRCRLRVLQSELKQACLTAAVRALWPTRRGLFVLMHVLGLDHARVAEVFETSVASVRITHARTLRTLEGFLGPRCQHLNPDNPCRCEDRLGVALARGLVDVPPQHPSPPASPFDGHTRDLPDLYRDLPPVQLDTRASAALDAACDSTPA
ncbi:MAG: hypothetical protein H0T76_19185 [Nannocystis sp.]|nr:sigma factor-like helix-turn-helix DNA-binding protein [Nannocystis sp.]MBA3548614.1 hypothetical protein [Nannocystis sp.]